MKGIEEAAQDVLARSQKQPSEVSELVLDSKCKATNAKVGSSPVCPTDALLSCIHGFGVSSTSRLACKPLARTLRLHPSRCPPTD